MADQLGFNITLSVGGGKGFKCLTCGRFFPARKPRRCTNTTEIYDYDKIRNDISYCTDMSDIEILNWMDNDGYEYEIRPAKVLRCKGRKFNKCVEPGCIIDKYDGDYQKLITLLSNNA